MLKRVIAGLLSLITLFSFSGVISAKAVSMETDLARAEKEEEKGGYSFILKEQTGLNYQIIRKYERSRNEANAAAYSEDKDYAYIKTILSALGVDQIVIDKLTEETLKDYANSLEITTTTSYTKTDKDGHNTYLSESDALQEVANDASMASSPVSGTSTDSYMKIVHTASYLGNASYLFSTTATWLKMPTYRMEDTVGSCAPTLAIDNSTRSGWYRYNVKEYVFTGIPSNTAYSEEREITKFANALNGDWYGSVGYVSLPTDINTSDIRIDYTDFTSYYQFKAYLRYPALVTNFNSVGCYSHYKSLLSISPSVSISFDTGMTLGVSATIGLDSTLAVDTRAAEILLHYVP